MVTSAQPSGATSRKRAATPLTAKGRDTRRRIMDAAKELFATHGYARVRVSDITEAAGLSPGAFYRYFDDRHGLTLELLRELTDQAFETSRNPQSGRPATASVVESTERYFEYYRKHRALFGVLVELSQTDAEVAELWAQSRQAFYARISRSLRRDLDEGRLREDLDIDVAAEMLGSMTEFYAFQRYVLGGSAIKDVGAEAAARTIADIWTAGTQSLRTNKPTDSPG